MKNINKFKNYEPASMAPPLNLFWRKAKICIFGIIQIESI